MRPQKIRTILDRYASQATLTETDSKMVVSLFDIPVDHFQVANTADDAVDIANKIGYPVVLKIVSPDIIHKTEAGGVKLNLSNDMEVRSAFRQIYEMANQRYPGCAIQGVSVQKMIMGGIEVIVGMKRDQTFGPTILFGMGGVFAELLEDVTLRIVPISRMDASEMISEIKGYRLLCGYRGSSRADIDSILDILLKTAQLSLEVEEITQIDLNPVYVFEIGQGSIVADARIILG